MRKAFGLLVAVLCATLFADESANTARVRIGTAKGVETRRVPLVRTGENATRYGNGETVVCNYSDKPYQHDQEKVPPHGYRILKSER